MKKEYSTYKIEIVKFSEVDVIRTSENYSKDIIIGNGDFKEGTLGSFFGQ